jgi:hypothetical protein
MVTYFFWLIVSVVAVIFLGYETVNRNQSKGWRYFELVSVIVFAIFGTVNAMFLLPFLS